MASSDMDDGFDTGSYAHYQSANVYSAASGGRLSNDNSGSSSVSRTSFTDAQRQPAYNGLENGSLESGSSGRTSSDAAHSMAAPRHLGVSDGIGIHQFASQPRLDNEGGVGPLGSQSIDVVPRPKQRPRPGRSGLGQSASQ
ncbi:hypothetical protein EC988_005644, partial [Linderina pennispora]